MQNGARVELAALQLFQHQCEGMKYKPTAKYIFLSPTAEMIGVRIYLQATDMDHILQTQVQHGIRREIDIDKIREVLHLKGECCVSNCANRHTSFTHITPKLIDPENSKPFYPYNGSILDGDDVDDMKDSKNYLRIVCPNACL